MKPAPFTYHRPQQMTRVLELLADHGTNASILAGGQSLLPLMNNRDHCPQHLIDINRLGEGGEISEHDNHIAIGALVRQTEIVNAPDHFPLLANALRYVGNQETRNLGTVCGALAFADPLSEIPLAFLVNGGAVELTCKDGRRLLMIDDFLNRAFQPHILPHEIISTVRWNRHPKKTGQAFRQMTGAAKICSAAGLATPVEGDALQFRLGIAGTQDRPVLLSVTGIENTEAAIEGFLELQTFITDGEAGSDYRHAVSRQLLWDVLADLKAGLP